MVMASGGVVGAIGTVLACLIIFAIIKLISFIFAKIVAKVNKNSALIQDTQDIPLKKRRLIAVILIIVIVLIIASPFIVMPFLVD